MIGSYTSNRANVAAASPTTSGHTAAMHVDVYGYRVPYGGQVQHYAVTPNANRSAANTVPSTKALPCTSSECIASS